MNRTTIAVALLFWISMIALFVGIYRFDDDYGLPWFIAAVVLLASAYGLRAWSRRQGPSD